MPSMLDAREGPARLSVEAGKVVRREAAERRKKSVNRCDDSEFVVSNAGRKEKGEHRRARAVCSDPGWSEPCRIGSPMTQSATCNSWSTQTKRCQIVVCRV